MGCTTIFLVTVFTSIFFPLVCWLNMSFERILSCGFMPTKLTWKSYTLMNSFVMSCNMGRIWCFEVTKFTKIFLLLMNNLDMFWLGVEKYEEFNAISILKCQPRKQFLHPKFAKQRSANLAPNRHCLHGSAPMQHLLGGCSCPCSCARPSNCYCSARALFLVLHPPCKPAPAISL